MLPVLLLALAAEPVLSVPDSPATAGPSATATEHHQMDAPLPPRPTALTDGPRVSTREVGATTTLFVNFDGVELGSCTPSDSKRNCHWYNNEEPIPPFSGTQQTKVSVLQAMRRDAADYGIRITGLRPTEGDYTMVIYGGTEEKYGALGSAPPGDCLDQLPNQIAFAHVDGELNDWINGGATTALHEAAHSWGLDHIETDRTIMFPSGNNEPTTFLDGCSTIVENTALTPATEVSCADLNAELCGDPNQQHSRALLERLFGGPYVDSTPPTVDLVEPRDGQYFQAPAEFDVVLDIRDDLHPQLYQASFWLGDDPKPEGKPFTEDYFSVTQLPIGTWDFHVELVDEAGHAARLDFTIEVGEDPPPEPQEDGGCAVGAGAARGVSHPGSLVVLLLGLVARRRRPR